MIEQLIAILVPILIYILAGFFAANQGWCWRKIVVSVIAGVILGGYAVTQGIEVNNGWLDMIFNSGELIAGIYIIDRAVKGIAKRAGIEWLYTDEPIEDEV